MYLVLTFRVVRPLLLLAVLAVALTRREYSLMLASFAIAFALMWIGSLHRRPRNRQTGLIRVAPLLALAAIPALMAAQEAIALNERQQLFNTMLESRDHAERVELRRDFERRVQAARAREEKLQGDWYRQPALQGLEVEGTPSWNDVRDATSWAAIVEPNHDDIYRLEREVLTHDQVAPFPRLDEAFFEYGAGEPEPLLQRLEEINRNIRGPRLTALLESGAQPPPEVWMTALVSDLRYAYGSSAPRTQELRRYMVQRATNGRSLLKPDAGPGVTFLVCFLLSAALLAGALMMGIGREKQS
jgi:hypothetical protein